MSQCLYTQKVFPAGRSFPNRMLELYLFNLFFQKLKYFTNHNRCLSQHACRAYWPLAGQSCSFYLGWCLLEVVASK